MIIWAAFEGMVVVTKYLINSYEPKFLLIQCFIRRPTGVLNSQKDEKAAQSRFQQSHCIQGKLALQDDNINLREEVEGLHRKFEALKRFAAQKKIRLPAEFEQYQ